MARVEVLDNVPADQVDAVVASFKADGATTVTKSENADGTFKVTANFP